VVARETELQALVPSVERDRRGDVEIVRLGGEIDLYAAAPLAEALDAAAQRSDFIVVDLTTVRFFDSSALGAVLRARRQVLGVGGNLVLVVAGAEASRVFQLTGLDRIFPRVGTLDEALEAVRDGA
jgi:anti-sigma B factor antagonist